MFSCVTHTRDISTFQRQRPHQLYWVVPASVAEAAYLCCPTYTVIIRSVHTDNQVSSYYCFVCLPVLTYIGHDNQVNLYMCLHHELWCGHSV